MSPYREPAPRGFRWADRPAARAVAMVLALVSLVVSMYVGYRYVGLIDCLQRQAAADANRTKAIAEVTDRERAADLALIMGPTAERSAAALREAATEARRETDRVRAANPAPTAVPCD